VTWHDHQPPVHTPFASRSRSFGRMAPKMAPKDRLLISTGQAWGRWAVGPSSEVATRRRVGLTAGALLSLLLSPTGVRPSARILVRSAAGLYPGAALPRGRSGGSRHSSTGQGSDHLTNWTMLPATHAMVASIIRKDQTKLPRSAGCVRGLMGGGSRWQSPLSM